jgi:hypothetical protein
MRRLYFLAVALLAIGCSSHSSLPTPQSPGNITPQIDQKKISKNGWEFTPLAPINGQQAFVTGLAVDSSHKIWATAEGYNGTDCQIGRVDTYVFSLMALSPKQLTVPVGQNAILNVSESNYLGAWTASTKKPSIATVTPNSQNGTFTVSGVAPGTTYVIVTDSQFNTASVKVTVQ